MLVIGNHKEEQKYIFDIFSNFCVSKEISQQKISDIFIVVLITGYNIK